MHAECLALYGKEDPTSIISMHMCSATGIAFLADLTYRHLQPTKVA
jgi:hypothetical protein